jgi:hypothetical protein
LKANTFWVAGVDMGLGHQRAIHPFRHLAEGGIINVNSAPVAQERELRVWERLRGGYELLSRLKWIPLFGSVLFGVLDYLQRIPGYRPERDMSRPNYQVRLLERVIRQGLCTGMLRKISEKPLPLLTSYMTSAIAADRAGHERVYCIICDTEVNRSWVAKDPSKSRIRYFVPCTNAAWRLRGYGVPEERIFHTGFPFPQELLGGPDLHVLKQDFVRRLRRLDPDGRFRSLSGSALPDFFRTALSPRGYAPAGGDRARPTLTFTVGGAGAQKNIGRAIAGSLRKKLRSGEVQLNLVAGVRPEVKSYFEKVKRELLPGCPFLQVIAGEDRQEYFDAFNRLIRDTDILWTKPSELSFFAGLGIPLILSPVIGSQEEYNKRWLLETGAGILQKDPELTDRWLFELLASGKLAGAAWNGFLNTKQDGTYSIIDILDADSSGLEAGSWTDTPYRKHRMEVRKGEDPWILPEMERFPS